MDALAYRFVLPVIAAAVLAVSDLHTLPAFAQGDTARAYSLGETPRPQPPQQSNLARAVRAHKLFKGLSISTFTRGRQAVICVYGYNGANYRLDAVQAARAVTAAYSGQFLTTAVRYYEKEQGYKEVLLTSRDITSLEAGTIKAGELALQAQEVNIGSYDGTAVVFEKYLAAAESLIEKGSYFEAEQIVDSLGPAPGGAAADRFARDMLQLSQGFDTYGDLYRAARILEKVVDERKNAGTLLSADADLTVERLIDLYLADKRYSDAENLLKELVAKPEQGQARTNNLERLAVVQLRLGKNEEALSALNEVLKAREAGPVAALARTLENIGDAYRALGRKGDAQASYKRARAVYDKAVVATKREQRIDYQVYAGRVKQLDEKLKLQ